MQTDLVTGFKSELMREISTWRQHAGGAGALNAFSKAIDGHVARYKAKGADGETMQSIRALADAEKQRARSLGMIEFAQ